MSVTAGRLAEVSGDSLGVEFFSRATKDVELGATFDLSPGELGVLVVLGNTRSPRAERYCGCYYSSPFYTFEVEDSRGRSEFHLSKRNKGELPRQFSRAVLVFSS